MDLGLKGKIAVVAGASKGLGYGVAKILAAEGAIVSLASRDESAINAAAERIREETGGDVHPVVADVRSPEHIQSWFEGVSRRHGGIDMLFANTGGPKSGRFSDFDDAAWVEAHELLLLSAIRLARVAVSEMKKRGGGSIVFTTSVSVKEPNPMLALSNVERAGVAALSKTLADEFAHDLIRVNSVVPGRIDTDRVRQLDEVKAKNEGTTVDEQRVRNEKLIPLGRYGSTDEYARPVVFLLSPAASYVTGATLMIDGGMVRGVQ